MKQRKRMTQRKRMLAIGLILIMLAGVLAGALTVFAQEPAGTEETAPPAPPEAPEEAPPEAPEEASPEAPEEAPPEPPEPPGDTAETGATAGEEETASEAASGETMAEETIITLVGKYDSADTAPVVRINEAARTITFRNHDLGRNYTLNYDETTRFLDAFGNDTNMAHLAPGDLVEVTFLKSSKHLNSLQAAQGDHVFRYTGLREYKLPAKISVGVSTESMANIRGSRYLLDLRTLVLVNGVESSVSSILEGDELTVVGADREIYALTVTRGHGYLSLSSDAVAGNSLVGAWIQLDHSIIRKITPQMLMAAPEGDYTLNIIGNGADYSAEVTITRGRETVVDTSGIPIEPPKTGNVKFEITPAEAELRIDGSVADKEEEMPLTYGIHTVELNAEGYVTMLRYLKVGSERAVVRLGMERDTNAQTNTENSGTGASAATSGDSTPGNVISEESLLTSDSSGATGESSDTGATGESTDTGAAGSSTDTAANTGTATQDTGNNTGAGTGNTTENNNAGQGGQQQNQQQNQQQQNQQQQNQQNQQQQQNQPSPEPQMVSRIYVDEPAGALMFLDGNYIGYIPGSFEKTAGIHTVTLQRPGYNTISYNIELDDGPSDRTFRFPELVQEGGTND